MYMHTGGYIYSSTTENVQMKSWEVPNGVLQHRAELSWDERNFIQVTMPFSPVF